MVGNVPMSVNQFVPIFLQTVASKTGQYDLRSAWLREAVPVRVRWYPVFDPPPTHCDQRPTLGIISNDPILAISSIANTTTEL